MQDSKGLSSLENLGAIEKQSSIASGMDVDQ
ncbi:hypothetical protein chiPu_0024628, partial [Chiloscyllium punctatum]|nr:hypothetical protein [Chiloscyllium punctatum]